MSSETSSRAEIMLSLVPYLLERGDVSVSEAAQDLDLSADQLRTLVRTLTLVGLPGEGGYWQMANELFDIDWDLLETQDRISLTHTVGLEQAPKLTAKETAALLAGLQMLAAIPRLADNALLASLTEKLARGTSGIPTEIVVAPPTVTHTRAILDHALTSATAVWIRYQQPDHEATERTVDPITVHVVDGQWYLQGWCHTRKAIRTFHVDRITEAKPTSIPIQQQHEPTPLFSGDDGDHRVRLRFAKELRPALGHALDDAKVITDGPIVTVEVPLVNEKALRRFVTRFGGDVEVLWPADVRQCVQQWAAEALSRYGALFSAK